MINFTKTSLFLICFILLMACVSSEKLLQDGRYKAAIHKSLNQLKSKNPNETETLILNEALSLYFLEVENKIHAFQNKHENVESYLNFSLNQLYDAFELYNSCSQYADDSNIEKLKLVLQNIQDTEQNLFSFYIEKAEAESADFDSSNNKVNARRAYKYYSKAKNLDLEFSFPMKEMEQMYANALERINIIIDPFETDVEWTFNTELSKKSGFKIYYLNQLKANTDCRIRVDCMFFDMDDEEVDQITSYQKEVKDGYTTCIDTAGNEIKTPKFKTVEANLIETTKTRKAEWRVEFLVENKSGNCTLRSSSFSPTAEYEIKHTKIKGDERAFPACYSEDAFPDQFPDVDEIKEDMADDILYYFRLHY